MRGRQITFVRASAGVACARESKRARAATSARVREACIRATSRNSKENKCSAIGRKSC